METYEDLRRNIMRLLDNREEMPSDVMKLVINIFERVEEKYKELRCYNSSIETYIQGNLQELISILQQRTGSERKEEQFYQINSILSQIQMDLEENLDDEEQKRSDNKIQEGIEEIPNIRRNNSITTRIVDMLEDSLKDIQSRQNRILSARGYSDRQIEDIHYEMMHFIRQMSNREQENIYNAFQDDDRKLTKQILEEYENYMGERQGKDKSNEEMFRENLDVGISLEEQRADAIEFKEKQEDGSQTTQLPQSSLEDLFK